MSQESDISERDGSFPRGKHKIQLCRSYTELGGCPYGEFCIFAHGVHELLMHQPALRVKKCRNYHTNGYCRFGERCNFRHEKNAKPKKKKNLYKFHRILNSYPDIILATMAVYESDLPKRTKQLTYTESSEASCQ